MSLLGILGAGAAIFTGVKKAWYAVKKPKPKVQVSAASGSVVGSQLPAVVQSGLPAVSTGGLPALAGVAAAGAVASQATGLTSLIPWWKGPGGKLQLPWNDPRVPEFLKQFSLDDSYLKVYYRAPRGYVVLRDAQGRPFAVMKQVAKQFGLWKPSPKPPISVTDWRCLRRAESVERKLRKICPKPRVRRVYATAGAGARASASASSGSRSGARRKTK